MKSASPGSKNEQVEAILSIFRAPSSPENARICYTQDNKLAPLDVLKRGHLEIKSTFKAPFRCEHFASHLFVHEEFHVWRIFVLPRITNNLPSIVDLTNLEFTFKLRKSANSLIYLVFCSGAHHHKRKRYTHFTNGRLQNR